VHPLSPKLHEEFLLSRRTAYDRQIAQIDEEFGRLIAKLDKTGTLANSYLIFTSDHGELFERGFAGHGFHFMYESVLHIPLLVHAPGQAARNDVFSPTSITDILPTLLHITGKEMPPDIDGMVLPGFGGIEDSSRPIFSVYAVDNSAFGPMKKAVIAMRKGSYKLIAYLGYENFDQVFELYNPAVDAEELVDLSGKELDVFSKLKQEFYFHLENANRPFIKK
jgi:arylsulfatase A-like enzyme